MLYSKIGITETHMAFMLSPAEFSNIFLATRQVLIHLCRMYFPTHINCKSSFPIIGLFGGIFHFYSYFKRSFCKQTVVCTVSLGHFGRFTAYHFHNLSLAIRSLLSRTMGFIIQSD